MTFFLICLPLAEGFTKDFNLKPNISIIPLTNYLIVHSITSFPMPVFNCCKSSSSHDLLQIPSTRIAESWNSSYQKSHL